MDEVRQAVRDHLVAKLSDADQATITRLADRLAQLVVTEVL